MGPKSKGVTSFMSADFRGKAVLTDEDLKILSIEGPADIFDKVNVWESTPVIALVVKLNNDNSEITDCDPVVTGDFFEEGRRVVTANNFWPDSKGVAISLGKIPGSAFTFSGSLQSNLIDSSALDVTYTLNGEATTKDELGIPGFSIRLFLTPADPKWVRFYLMLYPLPLDKLVAAQPLSCNPKFPGYKAYYGDIILGPRSSLLLKKNFGCPVAPMIVRGSPDPVLSSIITAKKLTAAVAATLRTAVKPEINKVVSVLSKRWGLINVHGESQLKHFPLDNIWPQPKEPTVVQPEGNFQESTLCICLPLVISYNLASFIWLFNFLNLPNVKLLTCW